MRWNLSVVEDPQSPGTKRRILTHIFYGGISMKLKPSVKKSNGEASYRQA